MEDILRPIQEWDIKDLKAAAYDELTRLELVKRNIRLIQDELTRRNEKNQIEGSAPRETPGGGGVAG